MEFEIEKTEEEVANTNGGTVVVSAAVTFAVGALICD